MHFTLKTGNVRMWSEGQKNMRIFAGVETVIENILCQRNYFICGLLIESHIESVERQDQDRN